jgi:hypothetical protein
MSASIALFVSYSQAHSSLIFGQYEIRESTFIMVAYRCNWFMPTTRVIVHLCQLLQNLSDFL